MNTSLDGDFEELNDLLTEYEQNAELADRVTSLFQEVKQKSMKAPASVYRKFLQLEKQKTIISEKWENEEKRLQLNQLSEDLTKIQQQISHPGCKKWMELSREGHQICDDMVNKINQMKQPLKCQKTIKIVRDTQSLIVQFQNTVEQIAQDKNSITISCRSIASSVEDPGRQAVKLDSPMTHYQQSGIQVRQQITHEEQVNLRQSTQQNQDFLRMLALKNAQPQKHNNWFMKLVSKMTPCAKTCTRTESVSMASVRNVQQIDNENL